MIYLELIQVKLLDNEFDKTTNKPTFDFKLKMWVWYSEFTENKLTYLGAKDNNGKVRFQYGKLNK